MKTLRLRDTEDHITPKALDETVVNLCLPGTVLVVVRSGILQRTLPVAIAEVAATMNQDMKGIQCYEGVDPLYVTYYLIRSERDVLTQCSKDGTTVASIETGKLQSVNMPLPPLAEQGRIVAAIEEQFTRLDAGVAALKRAQVALKRYRAAVLKAAVEGRLTEAWRAQHPDVRPASELLTDILAERRAKWEADLRAKGKDPAKARYEEPQAPQTKGLPELPPGWVWATVEQLGDVGTGATPLRTRADYYEGGTVPWVTSGALNAEIVVEATEFITERAVAETNAKVFPAGTLLLAMYGEGKTRGKVSELVIAAATNQACASIVFPPASAPIRVYLKQFLLSNYYAIRRQSAGGVQPNLNLSIVKGTVVPLPPPNEQEQVVAEAEQRLSVVSVLEATIAVNLKRAERLRQAILERAFTGRLVLQDPADEPASALLERIRLGRGAERVVASRSTYEHSAAVTLEQCMEPDVASPRQTTLWQD